MNTVNTIEISEEILLMNIIEENTASADMLCNSLGCAQTGIQPTMPLWAK